MVCLKYFEWWNMKNGDQTWILVPLFLLRPIVDAIWRRQWQPTPVLLPGKSHGRRSLVGCSPWGCKESDTTEQLHFHSLEKEMATHSSVLAWRIPGMGEPGGLPSMGSHRVGHDWSDLAAAAAMDVLNLKSLHYSYTMFTKNLCVSLITSIYSFNKCVPSAFIATVFTWWY